MLQVNRETREIFIYDVIGPSWAGMIGADEMATALAEIGKGTVKIRLNSPGGSVWDAMAMRSLLNGFDVSVLVDGVAASAATFFFDSEFHVSASKGAMIMIHDPWSIMAGNASAFRKEADTLDKHASVMLDLYEERMDATREEIASLLSAETWLTAKEALAMGLVDEIGSGETADIKVPSGMYRNTPAALIAKREPKVAIVPSKRITAKKSLLDLVRR